MEPYIALAQALLALERAALPPDCELNPTDGKETMERSKSQRKISYKCIYLPAVAEEGAPAMDPNCFFRRNPAHRTIEQIEAYASMALKPIDDSLSVRLPPSDLLDGSMPAQAGWVQASEAQQKWALQAAALGARPAPKPRKSNSGGGGGGGTLRWSAMNIL